MNGVVRAIQMQLTTHRMGPAGFLLFLVAEGILIGLITRFGPGLAMVTFMALPAGFGLNAAQLPSDVSKIALSMPTLPLLVRDRMVATVLLVCLPITLGYAVSAQFEWLKPIDGLTTAHVVLLLLPSAALGAAGVVAGLGSKTFGLFLPLGLLATVLPLTDLWVCSIWAVLGLAVAFVIADRKPRLPERLLPSRADRGPLGAAFTTPARAWFRLHLRQRAWRAAIPVAASLPMLLLAAGTPVIGSDGRAVVGVWAEVVMTTLVIASCLLSFAARLNKGVEVFSRLPMGAGTLYALTVLSGVIDFLLAFAIVLAVALALSPGDVGGMLKLAPGFVGVIALAEIPSARSRRLTTASTLTSVAALMLIPFAMLQRIDLLTSISVLGLAVLVAFLFRPGRPPARVQ